MIFYATEPHYIDHLAPVWLECKRRGLAHRFVIKDELSDRAMLRGIDPDDLSIFAHEEPAHVVTAGVGDLMVAAGLRYGEPIQRVANGRHLAYLEHGCGLSFGRPLTGYPGSHGARDLAELLLLPNEYAAAKDRAAHPGAHVVVCGCPKLDVWKDKQFVRVDPPVIGYATHWDCHTVPETRSSFPYYRESLHALAGQYRVIAHTHPCSAESTWEAFIAMGLETERDMETLFMRADLLICDCGSALYEFAATGRPVVVCNCPLYRRDVHHGLRFWENVPGLQVDEPGALAGVVALALNDPPEAQQARRAAVEAVYPNLWRATQIAADALEAWVCGKS